jgi:hypothetical protein
MKTFNPYQPIEKVPLFTQGLEMQSKSYAIKMDIPVEHKTEEGTITKMQPYECGTVSETFQLIPNSEVKLFSNDLIDSLPGEWETGKEMFDGSKYMMTQICKSGFGMSDLEVGDTVSVGIMWRNAYDMTRSLSFDMFANILSCLNGYTHNQWFTSFRFKHTPNNSNWKEVLNEAKQSIVFAADSIQDLAANLNKLNKVNVDTTRRLNSVRKSLNKDILGCTQWGKVVDRFISEKPANGNSHTLWDMTQACTHTFWNNGKNSNEINSWADLKTNERCVRNLTSIEDLDIVAES